MEKTKLLVLSIEDDAIKTRLQLVPEDYSVIYELDVFKQEYNKDKKAWEDSEKTMEKYNESIQELGGMPTDGQEIEVFTNEENGKAYVFEQSDFQRAEKPPVKDAGRIYANMEIIDVHDSPKGREIMVQHTNGVVYSFSFNTGQWIEKLGKFIPNPAKLIKAKERFNELFEECNIKWDDAERAIGLKVNAIVEKNALNPSSDVGWLRPLKLDNQELEQNIGEDDLPF